MLRVTVELVPHGVESRKRTLATMEIANDGTASDGSGNSEFGNYNGVLHAEYTPPAGRKGRVTNFARRKQSVWSLVGAFLKRWGHAKHPERFMQQVSSKVDKSLLH